MKRFLLLLAVAGLLAALASCARTETEITVPRDVTAITAEMYAGNKNVKRIRIHADVTEIEYGAFLGCGNLEAIEAEDGGRYASVDGVLFTADGGDLVCCPAAKPGTEYTAPASCAAVMPYAFAGCAFEKITFTGVLEGVGEKAFSGCAQLREITLAATLYNPACDAFDGCVKLENIYAYDVPDRSSYVRDVDGVLYNHSADVLMAYPCGRSSETYVLPESCLYIGENAFRGCRSIKKVEAPQTFRKIGANAFLGSSVETFEVKGADVTVSAADLQNGAEIILIDQ